MKDIPGPILRLAFRVFVSVNTPETLRLRFARASEEMLALAEGLTPAERRLRNEIPELPGVDEDMRDWSALMLLSHMALTNAALARVVTSLGNGLPFSEHIDYKQGFTPRPDVGDEAMAAFRRSMDRYVIACASLPALPRSRPRPTLAHPVFGVHGAKGWQGVAVAHTLVHLGQMKAIERAAREERP